MLILESSHKCSRRGEQIGEDRRSRPDKVAGSLSPKVPDHGSDAKDDTRKQNRDGDRRSFGRVRGREARRNNKKGSRESGHRDPLLGDSRSALAAGFFGKRSSLRPTTAGRTRHAIGHVREHLQVAVEGCPNDSLATFQKYLSLRVTVISFQGTRKSRQKGPKIRMIPMRKPEVHTSSFRMPRMETNPSDPD